MRSLGIDIGSFSIKVIELETSSKGYQIKSFYEFPLSQDPNKDRKIEAIDYLRQLVQKYDTASTNLVMGVKQSHISTRHRQFPFRERHKILKSIAFELEDDVPFSQDDAIFDAKITAYSGVNQAEVLAIACPKDFIEDSLQMASDCGIELNVLSVEGFALSNLIESWQEPPPLLVSKSKDPGESSETQDSPELPASSQAIVLLQLGHEGCLMTVFSNQSLVATRHLDWGAKSIAMALSKTYNTPFVESLKELRNKGFVLLNEEGATDDQVRFSNVVKSNLDELAQLLRLTLLEIKTEAKINIEEVFLVGGPSRLKNIGPYITQKIEIPTNRIKQLSQHPQLDFKSDQHGELSFGLALGLALEGIKKPRNPATSLLKGEFAQGAQSGWTLWEKWKPTAQRAALLFAIIVVYSMFKDRQSTNMADESFALLRSHAAQVANLRGTQATPRNVRNFIREQENIERSRKEVERLSQVNSSLEWLNRISRQAQFRPEWGVEVRRLNVVGNQLEIEGDASQPQALSAIESALRNIAQRGQVDQIQPQLTPRPRRQVFAFRLPIERIEERGN